MLSAAIDAWLVTLSRPAKKIAAALFFNTIFTPSLLCLLSGLVFTRLSGASGPSGLAGDRAKGWFRVLARLGALSWSGRSMEYHIMVFQTFCKHFAVPAICLAGISAISVGASLLAIAVDLSVSNVD
ncbi:MULTISPECIES: hypothetical protein [Pseudomonas]|uniref:hypothetical protein n=1 Tax=Pseudomonas TaxID=286 RepID=UPI0018B07ADC|nr:MULTISPECIES: hypothetical protein [Pseudomonas]WNZ81375.1 hypothetical protein QOM08_12090 [Pseudomonas sp. P105]